MNKNAGISTLKGIGEKTEKLFLKLGVATVDDLLHYYPRTYEIFGPPVPVSEVQEGHICTVSGAVFGRIQVSGTKNMQVTTLYLKDLTGTLKVIWFRMPFLRNTLGRSGPVILRGRVVRKRDGLVMEHPQIYDPAARYNEKLHSMQPVYGLTAGLTNNAFIKAVRHWKVIPYPKIFFLKNWKLLTIFPLTRQHCMKCIFHIPKRLLLKQEDALSLKNFSPLSFHCDM